MATASDTVTLSNAQPVVINADGNVVTLTRSDTGQPININVGTATDTADIQPYIDAVTQQLSAQNAAGEVLVQTNFIGSASSANGTTTVTLHPVSYQSNPDGLVLTYRLTSGDSDLNVNLSTAASNSDADVATYVSACSTTLQGIADDAATTARADADSALGISTLTSTATATATL